MGGNYIVTGGDNGLICIFNLATANHKNKTDVLHHKPGLIHNSPNASRVLSLKLDRKGIYLIVSSVNGRVEILRIINIGPTSSYEIIPILEVNVNFLEKTVSSQSTFSPDRKWIATGLQSKTKHYIIVWSLESGKPDRMLLTESGIDGLLDLFWHPRFNFLAALNFNLN